MFNNPLTSIKIEIKLTYLNNTISEIVMFPFFDDLGETLKNIDKNTKRQLKTIKETFKYLVEKENK